MKRLSVFLLLMLALVFTKPAPTLAQMSLGEVRTLVDGRLAQLWQIILTRQTIHYINHGHYFQGLISHGQIPADGLELFPDMQYSRPTDQLSTWVDFFDTDLPATMPMALVLNVYEGPLGNGFQAVIFVTYQGTVYTRAKGIGPLRGLLTYDWQLAS